MRTSISHMKEHMMCPMFAHLRNVVRRSRPDTAVALEVGTLTHAFLAKKLGGTPISEPVIVSDRAAAEFAVLLPQLEKWKLPNDIKIVHVEHELSMPIGEHEMVGTLDAIVKYNDMFWHLQHKTLAATIPVATFIEQQATDWHEQGYGLMAIHNGFTPWGGSILNVLRKRKFQAGQSQFETMLHFLPFNEKLANEALEDMYRVLEEMKHGRPIKNRAACGGPYRNSLCQYKGVCDHELEITDDKFFVTTEQRYASKV